MPQDEGYQLSEDFYGLIGGGTTVRQLPRHIRTGLQNRASGFFRRTTSLRLIYSD